MTGIISTTEQTLEEIARIEQRIHDLDGKLQKTGTGVDDATKEALTEKYTKEKAHLQKSLEAIKAHKAGIDKLLNTDKNNAKKQGTGKLLDNGDPFLEKGSPLSKTSGLNPYQSNSIAPPQEPAASQGLPPSGGGSPFPQTSIPQMPNSSVLGGDWLKKLYEDYKKTPDKDKNSFLDRNLYSSEVGPKHATAEEQRAWEAAHKELGVRYSYGGGDLENPTNGIHDSYADRYLDYATPGWDCSSLERHIWYKAYGSIIPRTAAEQAHVGRQVSLPDAPIGAAVFPPGEWNNGNPTHVQSNMGNGKVIEAPQSGGHVQISDIDPNSIVMVF